MIVFGPQNAVERLQRKQQQEENQINKEEQNSNLSMHDKVFRWLENQIRQANSN